MLWIYCCFIFLFNILCLFPSPRLHLRFCLPHRHTPSPSLSCSYFYLCLAHFFTAFPPLPKPTFLLLYFPAPACLLHLPILFKLPLLNSLPSSLFLQHLSQSIKGIRQRAPIWQYHPQGFLQASLHAGSFPIASTHQPGPPIYSSYEFGNSCLGFPPSGLSLTETTQ